MRGDGVYGDPCSGNTKLPVPAVLEEELLVCETSAV